MEKYSINIATQFNDKLGGRWKQYGPFSGQEFYEKLLLNKFNEAFEQNEKLHIYLDGAKPYGSSFLDQSFGELSRICGIEKVRNNIVFHTEYYGWIVKFINYEIWK